MTSKHGCPRRPGPPRPRWVATKWVLRCCAAIWSPTARCTPSWLTIAMAGCGTMVRGCRRRLLSLLRTWPSDAAGHGPAGCRPCSSSVPASCSWPPMVWPTPRSPSVWAFRAQLSSPAAAATCTAGWLGSLIGPGQVGRRPCAGLTGLRSSRSRSTRPHPGWTTHWSTRLLARELGVSRDTVARVWREYGIKPWRAETFKFST